MEDIPSPSLELATASLAKWSSRLVTITITLTICYAAYHTLRQVGAFA